MARDRSTVKRGLAAVALLEMLEEEDDRVPKRGKTRHWIKQREEKGYFTNIHGLSSSSSISLSTSASHHLLVFPDLTFSTAALLFLFLFVERSLVPSSPSE